jgi:hypothetical protein
MENISTALLDAEDNRPTQHLVTLVQTRSYGRVQGLRLEWRGRGLVLRGQAATYYIKQLAQQAVLDAKELPLLANEIEVTGRPSPSLG